MQKFGVPVVDKHYSNTCLNNSDTCLNILHHICHYFTHKCLSPAPATSASPAPPPTPLSTLTHCMAAQKYSVREILHLYIEWSRKSIDKIPGVLIRKKTLLKVYTPLPPQCPVLPHWAGAVCYCN